MNLNETKQFMIEIAKQAGDIARKGYRKDHDCSTKDKHKHQVVCEIDLEVEKFLKKKILGKFPGHSILAEESADEPQANKDSEYLWVIDPIDGTRNYLHGHPNFGVSIALAKNKEVIIGVVYLPIHDWLFSAEKGKGAEWNGKKISVSKKGLDEDTLGNYGCAFYKEKKRQLEILDKYIDVVKKLRIEGSAVFSFCMVAAGTYDCYMGRFTNPWDFAASCLIIEEAGGKVTDFKGNKWNLDMTSFVASNGRFHDKLLEIVKN